MLETKTTKKYRTRGHAARQTGGDFDGDRKRREGKNVEEAYRIDTVKGRSK